MPPLLARMRVSQPTIRWSWVALTASTAPPLTRKWVSAQLRPSERLTVQTATSNFGMIHTDGTITVGTYVGGGGVGGYFGTKSNHPLHFFSNNSGPRMTVDVSGDVGIGTTTPHSKLDVNGDILVGSAGRE